MCKFCINIETTFNRNFTVAFVFKGSHCGATVTLFSRVASFLTAEPKNFQHVYLG